MLVLLGTVKELQKKMILKKMWIMNVQHVNYCFVLGQDACVKFYL